MIITCTYCSMRLQVDDEKVPARPFTLRCPKCQNIVHAQPPALGVVEQSAVTVGHSPASGNPRLEGPAPAPPYKLDSSVEKHDARAVEKESPASTATDNKELLRMLAALLQRGTQASESAPHGSRFEWEGRRVLVCVGEKHRETVARNLAESDYQVYVAENKAQAIERMRDERMDIIILSSGFDPAEQGAAFITREVNSLRPTERRRLFLVQLSETARTLDAHAAFINNVSLMVNCEDIGKMGRGLERALRDYNELYRNFNEALGVSPI